MEKKNGRQHESSWKPGKGLCVAWLGRDVEGKAALEELLKRAVPGGSIVSYAGLRQAVQGIETDAPGVLFELVRQVSSAGLKRIGRLKRRFPALPVVLNVLELDGPGVFLALQAGVSACVAGELGATQLQEALERAAGGLRMLCPKSVELLSAHMAKPYRPALLRALTAREERVMSQLLMRRCDKEIADEMGVSPGTVHVHLANVYRKLEAHNRVEACQRYEGIRT
jgi:DNA-binding NarL/FixJ family response regulator